MPKFAKVPPAEVERLKRRQPTTRDLSPYVAFLETLKSGDWGAVALEEGESQRAIKRRLTTTAKQKGIGIRYKKAKNGQILFEVR